MKNDINAIGIRAQFKSFSKQVLDKKFYTIRETANVFGISKGRVLRLIEAEVLRTFTSSRLLIRRHIRICGEDINWLCKMMQAAHVSGILDLMVHCVRKRKDDCRICYTPSMLAHQKIAGKRSKCGSSNH
jgi:hypothetical protein